MRIECIAEPGMTDEQMRATLAALEKLKANDNGSPCVDEKFAMYEEEIADKDGVMIINALGDREDYL